MSNRDDLHAGDRLPKDNYERKPTQDNTVRAKVMQGIVLRILADLIHCTIKLIKKHPGSPSASSGVPIHLPLQPLPAQQGGFAETRRSRLQLVAKVPSCSAPGDQFHGSIVNLLQPKLDLPLPRFCRTFVDGRVQALNQGIDQRGTRLQGQGEGVAKQFRRMALHESILPRAALVGRIGPK